MLPEANDREEDHGDQTLANLEFEGEFVWEETKEGWYLEENDGDDELGEKEEERSVGRRQNPFISGAEADEHWGLFTCWIHLRNDHLDYKKISECVQNMFRALRILTARAANR
jgi:hypothetical protein